MYKLYLFKTDGHKAEYEYKSKPTFQDMYEKIGCDMIEMSTAKMPEYSNRKDGYTDIYFDEEFLLKAYLKKYNFQIMDFNAGYVGNNGLTSNRKLECIFEHFTIINKIRSIFFLDILFLFVRLIKLKIKRII